MNYPGNIKKTYTKIVNYGNRGMDLENLINIACENYIEKDIAIIYKKPTPIQVVKYDYSKSKITDAFYKSPSTLDYNGVYKGHYIEFDAKNTNQKNLPISNIAKHQIKHIRNILNHGGIAFLIIMINEEIYILSGNKVLWFIDNETRKSITYNYIQENGIKLNYNYLKGVDFIPGVDILLKEISHGKEY